MPTQARVSYCSGLARALSLGIALSTSACAYLPATADSARPQLDFIAQMMSASPAEREVQWQALRTDNSDSDSIELRLGLMQSIPDHSGYDPAAARRRLKTFLSHKPSPDLAAVARMRMGEIDSGNSCHDELSALRKRMTMMVDIERRQSTERR